MCFAVLNFDGYMQWLLLDSPAASQSYSTQEWDPLPPIIMRKYIAYARKYCHPILDDGAKQVIQDFYLQLRKRKNFMDSTPVTTRQLEALIRLAVSAEARTHARTHALTHIRI